MVNTQNKYLVPGIYLILLLLTLAAFWQVRDCDFITYDDGDYVTHNPHVWSGFNRDSIIWAFTAIVSSNWHPLTLLSHMADCQIYGMNPAGHHFINLLLHIANTLLLFRLLSLMTSNVWCSFFVAAMFGWHPLHVESVAWVSERKDVLSTFFGLWAMIFYVKYVKNSEFSSQNSEWEKDKSLKIRRRPSSTDYWLLTTVFYILSLLSKSMLVTMPFVLLLLDYWPLGRFGKVRLRRLFCEKVPLLVLSAVASIIIFFAQHSGGAVSSLKILPIRNRIANASISYVVYLEKTIYPHGLAILYPHPGSNVSMTIALVCNILLVLITICLVYFGYRRRYLIAGWLWYLGMLVPVIGLIQVGPAAMTDHYTYMPLVGIFIIISWGAAEFAERLRCRRFILPVSTAAVLIVLLLCTRNQVNYWRNNQTISEHAISVTENNYMMHNNYGNSLLKTGRLAEAALQFNRAIQINPNSTEVLNNLGVVLARQGRVEDAVIYFNKAIAIDPCFADAYCQLGIARALQKRIDEAVVCFTKALQIDPESATAHNKLGTALAMQNKPIQAAKHLEDAVRIMPNNPKFRRDLESFLLGQQKISADPNRPQVPGLKK